MSRGRFDPDLFPTDPAPRASNRRARRPRPEVALPR